MALFYADASALVKLVLDEPESAVLRTYLDGADVISCELVLSEIPRAIRRAATTDPSLPRGRLLTRAGELLDAIGLLALDRELLIAAGTLAEPEPARARRDPHRRRDQRRRSRRIRDLRRTPGRRRPPRRPSHDRPRRLTPSAARA